MKTKHIYLENKVENLFVEATASDELFLIKRGHIGQACLVFEVNIASSEWMWRIFKRLKTDFITEGYIENTPSKAIIEGSKAVLIDSKKITSDEKYATLTNIGNFAYLNEGEDFFAWHFSDGLNYHSDLDLIVCIDIVGHAGLIIEGDVNVKGVFGQYRDSYPQATLILGNVFCQSFIHEDSHVVIDGNLSVEQTVFGYYNDGSLKIMGDIAGEAMISYDHAMWAEGEYLLFRSDIFNGEVPEWINPKLLDLENSLDTEEMANYIYSGKSVLRKGHHYSPPQKNIKTVDAEVKTPAVDPFYDPELADEINELAMQNDNMGMTLLLVNWHTRNAGWSALIESRLCAPSVSESEIMMLKKALNDFKNGEITPTEKVSAPEGYIPPPIEFEWSAPDSGQVWSEMYAHPSIKKSLMIYAKQKMRLLLLLQVWKTPNSLDNIHHYFISKQWKGHLYISP